MWLLFQRSLAPWRPLIRKKLNCWTVPLRRIWTALRQHFYSVATLYPGLWRGCGGPDSWGAAWRWPAGGPQGGPWRSRGGCGWPHTGPETGRCSAWRTPATRGPGEWGDWTASSPWGQDWITWVRYLGPIFDITGRWTPCPGRRCRCGGRFLATPSQGDVQNILQIFG